MNAVLKSLQGFVVLYFLLMVLVMMVPGNTHKKYIRFFAKVILVFAIFYPLLTHVFEDENFLKEIKYDAFANELKETSQDAQKIAYLNNEKYKKEYENAIKKEITALAEQYGYAVKNTTVCLSDTFEIKKINLELSAQGKEDIVIGKIILENETTEQIREPEDAAYQELKEKMLQYFQLTKEQLSIVIE